MKIASVRACFVVLMVGLSTASFAKRVEFSCPYQPGDKVAIEKDGWVADKANVGDFVKSYNYALVENTVDLNDDGKMMLICGYILDLKDERLSYKFDDTYSYLEHVIPLSSNGKPATCTVLDVDGNPSDDDSVQYLGGVGKVNFACEVD